MIKRTFEDPNTLVCFTCSPGSLLKINFIREKKAGIMNKKNIIITSGPTNERIDSVMKITNMSTGKLGATVADELLQEEELGTLFYLSPKLAYKPKTQSDKLQLVTIESTLDLLKALRKIITDTKIYGMVHASAVGDYYGEYTFTGEDLAAEIAKKLSSQQLTEEEIKNKVLSIIENPEILTDNTHKISSYEKNLMVKLGLTPKVIGEIKKLDPDILLIGFKLLDGVKKEELLEVADKLRQKNDADYIVANNLSEIHNGMHKATILNKEGIYTECKTKQEIAKSLRKILFPPKMN